jgi:hypothetical protein
MRTLNIFNHLNPTPYFDQRPAVASGFQDIGKRMRGIPMLVENHGQRVVDGYRRVQPASDMSSDGARDPSATFQPPVEGPEVEPHGRNLRQTEMDIYARWCGRALALSHARSGSPSTINGYMGKSDVFDKAIASFSGAYADQNEKDHAALDRAVRSGKLKAVFENDRSGNTRITSCSCPSPAIS